MRVKSNTCTMLPLKGPSPIAQRALFSVELELLWQKAGGAVKRFARLEQIRRMDPVADGLYVYRLGVAFEFPWDYARALELALYRTYAVPGIGRLLARTAELTERTQKR